MANSEGFRIPERILVVAPHPDDETLGAGGLISRAVREGHEVHVCFMTLGDGFREDAARYYLSLDVSSAEYLHLGYERQTEAARAMARLGLGEDHLTFLGFPDGGLDTLFLSKWGGEPFQSVTTGANRVPYLSAWTSETPYLGETVVDLLGTLLERVQPEMVVMPSSYDTHPDHWATNALTTLACARAVASGAKWASRASRMGYLVHWPAWPFPLVHRPKLPMRMPANLAGLAEDAWVTLELEAEDVERKRQALLQHGSQVELIRPFMMAFVRTSEVFLDESGCLPATQGGPLSRRTQVRLPARDMWSRVTRRGNPLAEAFWEVTPQYLGVRVRLNRPWKDLALEVNLHPIDTEDMTPFDGWVGDNEACSSDIEVELSGQDVMLHWPRTDRFQQPRLMAGIQAYQGEHNLGKLPFRLIETDMD